MSARPNSARPDAPPAPSGGSAAEAERRVRGALALRAWALAFLAGGSASPPPEVDAGAWRLFLVAERCALPLQSRLDAAGLAASLPPAALAAVRERATRELQRALSARAQLRLLSGILAERGWRAAVLKGGEALLRGELVDVADVDVLVPTAHADPLAGALEESAGAKAADSAPPAGAAGRFHVAPRGTANAVKVEVHYDLPDLAPADLWDGWRASPEPALFTLAPAPHLLHVLTHAVVTHLERRGALRDLLLLRAALAACTPAEVAGVEARVASHRCAGALSAMLAMARAGDSAGDPFRDVAALTYLFHARPPSRPLRHATSAALAQASYALAAGDGEYRALWGRSTLGAVFAWEEGAGASLRRVPWVGWAARAGWRAAHFAALTPRAWRLAREARRLAADGE